MINELLKYLEDKKILILGYGREGKSTYLFLRKYFPEKKLYISDKNESIVQNDEIKNEYTVLNLGEGYLKNLNEYDLIIKAPGISLKDEDISSYKEKLTSELELFLEFIECKTIGITGTKGKSTTSTIMYNILKDQGKDVFLVGNIGNPVFNEIEKITNESYVVIELSSHSLEFVKKSPHIAILLNIFEEHLDYYSSMEKYVEAKLNIAKYQNKEDYFLYNADNENILNYKKEYKSKEYSVSISNEKSSFYIKNDIIFFENEPLTSANIKMKLQGKHIVNNIMFILGACKILDLDLSKALNTIEHFEPLEHRMEFVGKYNGIYFYNDSIATIPEATINAIEALKDVNTLIVGGNDRGVNLDGLVNYLKSSNVENIICLPKTGEYIYNALSNEVVFRDTLKKQLDNDVFRDTFKKYDTFRDTLKKYDIKNEALKKHVVFIAELKEAVEHAKKVTKENRICLLSPAASSFGYFKNFEERGNLFKEYVKNK